MVYLIGDYLWWHFVEVPKQIFKVFKNFLKFGIHYFSVSFLFKTLFSHWHKYSWSYPKGFDFGKYFEVWFSNLISRTIGFILRSFLILGWLFFEVFILLLGTILFLWWIFFPAILIFSFYYGIKILL